MVYKFNTNYSTIDFTADEMKSFENLIMAKTKPEERTIGLTFIYRGILFAIESIIVSLDSDEKIIAIRQLTTNKKLVTPKGILTN